LREIFGREWDIIQADTSTDRQTYTHTHTDKYKVAGVGVGQVGNLVKEVKCEWKFIELTVKKSSDILLFLPTVWKKAIPLTQLPFSFSVSLFPECWQN
jgi:hypothetical protein